MFSKSVLNRSVSNGCVVVIFHSQAFAENKLKAKIRFIELTLSPLLQRVQTIKVGHVIGDKDHVSSASPIK